MYKSKAELLIEEFRGLFPDEQTEFINRLEQENGLDHLFFWLEVPPPEKPPEPPPPVLTEEEERLLVAEISRLRQQGHSWTQVGDRFKRPCAATWAKKLLQKYRLPSNQQRGLPDFGPLTRPQVA